jgi:UDP-2,3-diacylglucosamine pyrophosphatase LpxH
MKKIIVVSDVHLGYSESNVKDFNNFLQEVNNRTDVGTLVILGDFVDMWRRDISGLFLENHETLGYLLELKKNKDFYYVVGNHDYHLKNLVKHNYPIEFREFLRLPGNGVEYVFKHGWEFSDEQQWPMIELMCYNTSDKRGEFLSMIWKLLTSKVQHIDSNVFIEEYKQDEYLQSVYPLQNLIDSSKMDEYLQRSLALPADFINPSKRDEYLQNLLASPKIRYASNFFGVNSSDVERNAANYIKDKQGQLLVFGHTHKPFYSKDQHLVNTGSWLREEDNPNTWVELEGNNVHVMQYGNEITNNPGINRHV